MPLSYIYKIHDNGGIPFKVKVLGDIVQIWKENGEDETLKYSYLLHVDYIDIFLGRFPFKRWRPDVCKRYLWKRSFIGNSILLSIGNSKYVYIGESIWEFNTEGDRILEYYSPIGNSDVPYPFAVGETYTYLMLEKTRFPNSLLDEAEDPYVQRYGVRRIISKKAHRTLMSAQQILPVRMIHNRLY